MRAGERSTAVRHQPRVREAYRAIRRYMHRQGLRVGDLLPPQETFARELGMSHTTLNAAMQWLVSDGVIRRKTSVGTTIESLGPSLRKVWAVGVPVGSHTRAGYHWVLEQYLRRTLATHGCADISLTGPCHEGPDGVYLRYADLHEPDESHRVAELDMIVSGVPVVGAPVPAITVAGTYGGGVTGVAYDTDDMILRACRHLGGLGCRRLSLLHCDKPYWDGFLRALGALDLPPHLYASLSPPGKGIEGGQQAAVFLASVPREERPDGIVTLDDHFGVGLTDGLRDLPSYRPAIVVVTHRQMPRLYGIPVYRLEIDIAELARLAVERVMAWILEGIEPCGMVRYEPRLHAQASRFVPEDGEVPGH